MTDCALLEASHPAVTTCATNLCCCHPVRKSSLCSIDRKAHRFDALPIQISLALHACTSCLQLPQADHTSLMLYDLSSIRCCISIMVSHSVSTGPGVQLVFAPLLDASSLLPASRSGSDIACVCIPGPVGMVQCHHKR